VFAFHSHAVHLQQGRAAVKNLSRLKIISVYVDIALFIFARKSGFQNILKSQPLVLF